MGTVLAMQENVWKHQVQFYETDLMGIVHHSNYLRFLEEARVAWAHSVGLIDYQKPESAAQFAVLETRVRHLRPAKFGDILSLDLQVRRQGRAQILFQYKIHRNDELICVGQTAHVSLDQNLKPTRIPEGMQLTLEKQPWIETWLLNLFE